MRFIKFSRPGSAGWGILNHEGDLVDAAAGYHRSQSERYKQAERQQAPNGEWFLSPRAFLDYVSIGFTTLADWRKNGVPVLGGEQLIKRDFLDGNGKPTPFCSERQAHRIVAARDAQPQGVTVAQAAQERGLPLGRVRRLVREKKGKLHAGKKPERVGPRTVHKCRLSLEALDKELQNQERKLSIEDPISAREAAELCRVHPGTVGKWARAGKIPFQYRGHDNGGGRRLIVSRAATLNFAASVAAVLGTGAIESWLYERQVLAQYPNVSKDMLKYYARYPLPSLGRPIQHRRIERPAGLRCPHKVVRQFCAKDALELNKWVANGKPRSRATPTTEATAANGASPQTTTAAPHPMPKRRGPETSAETLELGKFCYDKLHRKIARRVICQEVHRLFGDREGFDESSVTIYARRYATNPKINKPWPV